MCLHRREEPRETNNYPCSYTQTSGIQGTMQSQSGWGKPIYSQPSWYTLYINLFQLVYTVYNSLNLLITKIIYCLGGEETTTKNQEEYIICQYPRYTGRQNHQQETETQEKIANNPPRFQSRVGDFRDVVLLITVIEKLKLADG